jgi:alpha-beta hydrolase superfamily lysophospholipase
MRLPSLVTLALALPLSLALDNVPQARADEEKVRFETGDGAELRGTFYRHKKTKKTDNPPTVLMIHPVAVNSQVDGWEKLAKDLNDKGCAVLTFDLRGHGNSTTVDPEVFWSFQHNQKGLKIPLSPNRLKDKDTIAIKDFSERYAPILANDIAAAKLFLDRKNDADECNSANLVVLGAESGATLGLLWMCSEQYRYQVLPPGVTADKPDGKDIACALWLSMSPSLGTRSYASNITRWLKTVGVDKKIPMSFLYAKDLSQEAFFAQQCLNTLSPSKKDVFTVKKDIATKLSGHKMLNDKLDTQKLIVNFIEAFMKENQANNSYIHEVDKNPYVWRFSPSSVPIPAKLERQKALAPLPLQQMGIQTP